MKKNVVWIVLGVVLVVAIAVAAVLLSNKGNTGVVISSTDDMRAMIDSIYDKCMPGEKDAFDTEVMDISDDFSFKRFTGLQSNENVESFVLSAPFINVNPYEFAVIKAKAGANIEAMKQEMYDNLDMNMWICVSAEKLYITNYGDIIVVVMGRKEDAKLVYDAFKEYVGNNVGKELEKTNEYDEDVELPPELIIDQPVADGFDTPVPDGVDTPIDISGESVVQ